MSWGAMEPPKGKLTKAEVGNLEHLLQQYDQALGNSAVKIASCEKSKEDYGNLKRTLQTLPHKLQYDAMLPLGTRAFCPGKIVHTNEIVCRLGDNWYIETSAKTAAEIVTLRLQRCDEILNSLRKEEELYRSWRDEVHRQKLETLRDGTIEISEEYDEEKEKQWRTRHRHNLRKYHQQLAQERRRTSVESTKESDSDLWSRLDELELEEELEEAGLTLESVMMNENKPSTKTTKAESNTKLQKEHVSEVKPFIATENVKTYTEEKSVVEPKARKKVSFSTENIVHNFGGSGVRTDLPVHPLGQYIVKNTADSNYDNVNCNIAVNEEPIDPLVIHFKHSASISSEVSGGESNPEKYNNSRQIVVNPSDIYNYFGNKNNSDTSEPNTPTASAPKSILKTKPQRWPNNDNLESVYNPEPVHDPLYNHFINNFNSIGGVADEDLLHTIVPFSKSKQKNPLEDESDDDDDEDKVPVISVKDTVVERVSSSGNNESVQSRSDFLQRDKSRPVSLFKQSQSNK